MAVPRDTTITLNTTKEHELIYNFVDEIKWAFVCPSWARKEDYVLSLYVLCIPLESFNIAFKEAVCFCLGSGDLVYVGVQRQLALVNVSLIPGGVGHEACK